MYEVFVNETPLIITSFTKKNNTLPTYPFHSIDFIELMKKLNKKKCKGIVLISDNLKKDWANFTQNFEVIVAAGGLVLNKKKRFYLFTEMIDGTCQKEKLKKMNI